ncbi:MAG TPA: FAD binding domain-containing protein [Blastocatellia bacterium]|nr:FAD binding domain-containing protein [Blastocatellia bacterium]
MRDFVYHRPATLDEARRLAFGEGAMLLAGGQTLLRDMKRGRHSPESLVDVTGLVPGRIESRDGAVVIGAGATHAEVAGSALLRERLPVLAALAGHIGDPAVRHRGTLGGALAANEPAGDYPSACLALGATVHTTEREVVATEFFAGHCRTVLEPGEIVTAVTFPAVRQAAWVKFLNPAARYAMVGVFAALAADGSPRVAVTGARVDGAFRWREAEAALTAAFVAGGLRDIHLPPDGLLEDLFADAAYRGHLAGVLARRAVALAAGPAPGVMVLSHGSRAGTDIRQ